VPIPPAPALLLPVLLLLGLPAPPAAARGAPDLIDITAVSIEGATAAECEAHVAQVVSQARTLSLATSPPYGLADGLRSFYDHVLPLDARGEHRSVAQLSSSYVAGHGPGGAPDIRVVAPFLRLEVTRPPGTPENAPSRIAIAWLWLQRLAESPGPGGGRPLQRPLLHRFDFAGEVVTSFGTWGQATAPCRQGGDGAWFGAVAVWTYLAP